MTASGQSALIRRSRGDDVVIEVRIRRQQYELLAGDGIHLPPSIMQLVAEEDGTHGICFWTANMPRWPEPVPGNAAAARDLKDGRS